MKFQKKHGASKGGPFAREYRIWKNMRTRCNNPRNETHARYGAIGIRVCERWDSFENFLTDMGAAPSDEHTLDRKDNALGYSSGNCRWATQTEQQRNRRNNKLDESSAALIRQRLASGMSMRLVAIEFCVSKKLVNEIKQGRSWKPRPEQPSLFGALGGGL